MREAVMNKNSNGFILVKKPEIICEPAGWMSREDAAQLREAVAAFG